MRAFTRTLGLVLLLTAHAEAAEHAWPAASHADGADSRFSVSVGTRAGLVTAPFVTTAFSEVSGFGVVLTGAIAVQLTSTAALRVRLPLSVVRLDFPAGAQVAESALGNLELGLEYPLQVRPATRLALAAAFLAPSAEHGPATSLLANRALALASALNGGQDSSLLTPGVTGMRLGASLVQSARPFELRASLDLPMLVRISGAGLPEEARTHPVGVLPTVYLGAVLWITSSFGASLGGGLIAEALRVQEPALPRDRARRLQGVVRPGLHLGLGSHVALGLEASVPVGGNLGERAWSIGVHGRLEL